MEGHQLRERLTLPVLVTALRLQTDGVEEATVAQLPPVCGHVCSAHVCARSCVEGYNMDTCAHGAVCVDWCSALSVSQQKDAWQEHPC